MMMRKKDIQSIIDSAPVQAKEFYINRNIEVIVIGYLRLYYDARDEVYIDNKQIDEMKSINTDMFWNQHNNKVMTKQSIKKSFYEKDYLFAKHLIDNGVKVRFVLGYDYKKGMSAKAYIASKNYTTKHDFVAGKFWVEGDPDRVKYGSKYGANVNQISEIKKLGGEINEENVSVYKTITLYDASLAIEVLKLNQKVYISA